MSFHSVGEPEEGGRVRFGELSLVKEKSTQVSLPEVTLHLYGRQDPLTGKCWDVPGNSS